MASRSLLRGIELPVASSSRLGGCSCSGQQAAAAPHPWRHAVHSSRAYTPSVRVRSAVQDELDLADGWAVEVSTPKTPQVKAAKKAKAPAAPKPQPSSPQASPSGSRGGQQGPRFTDMKSLDGKMSLSLLKAKLQRAEEEAAASGKPLPATQPGRKSSAPRAAPKRKVLMYEDDDGNTWAPADEDEEVTEEPEFELNLMNDDMEVVEYDGQGRVASRTSTSRSTARGQGAADDDSSDDDDEFDFTGSDDGSWKQLAAAVAADLDEEVLAGPATGAGAAKKAPQAAAGPQKRAKPPAVSALPSPTRKTKGGKAGSAAQGASGAMVMGDDALLLDDGDEDHEYWGVEELEPRGSLMEELGVVKGKGGKRASRGVGEELGVHVAWGGNASSSAVDLEEQERLLSLMFKPHKVRELMDHQRAALAAAEQLKRNSSGKDESKMHRQLRIIQGTAAGKRLLSSRGPQTRPMMEKVRAAIFNMIQSQAGTISHLPHDARWLDLFAGTGSVGLEALSRGVREAHFVEMDPWVTKNILGKNITTCGLNKKSVVHTSKAEDFLKRAIELPRFAGGAFDFVSMCPPYLLVSYPELFDLLTRGQLLHANTILFVEYPKQLSHEIPSTVGPLSQVRKRKYGRTHIVVYGPLTGDDEEQSVEEEVGEEDF